MKVKILFYKGTRIFSRLIQWRTFSPYSHTAIMIDNIIYEAVEGQGVRGIVAGRKPDSLTDTIVLDIPDDQLQLAISFALDNIGARYDWAGILLFLGRPNLGVSYDNKWFCSEFVTRFLEIAKVIPKQRQLHSPGSLFTLLSTK